MIARTPAFNLTIMKPHVSPALNSRFLLVLAFLVGLGIPRTSAADPAIAGCPPCTLLVYSGGGITVISTDAVRDTSRTFSFRTARAAYNLPMGTLRASASTGSGFVNASDVFMVSGVPAGTPLNFTAHLHIQGSLVTEVSPFSTQRANAYAWLLEGTSNLREFSREVSSSTPPRTATINDDMTITIQNVSPNPINLNLILSASTSDHGGTADLQTQLSFTGLPQGSVINSCQGYLYSFPTAIQNVSWSWIKAGVRLQ